MKNFFSPYPNNISPPLCASSNFLNLIILHFSNLTLRSQISHHHFSLVLDLMEFTNYLFIGLPLSLCDATLCFLIHVGLKFYFTYHRCCRIFLSAFLLYFCLEVMGKTQLCIVTQRNNYSKICLRNKIFPERTKRSLIYGNLKIQRV